MSTQRVLVTVVAALASAVLVGGCKKKPTGQKPLPAPSISPSNKQPARTAPQPPTSATPLDRRRQTGDEWRNTRLDQGVKKAKTASPGGRRDAGAAKETDAAVAARRKAAARRADEKRVEASLQGATAQLKSCLSSAAAGNVKATIRVHRSGYVTSASLSGVSGEASRCATRVLKSLRVGSLAGGTMVLRRTFKITKRKKK